MFYQIFLSPQVKLCTIITYKHGIYKLPRELPNDLKDLRKLGNIRKVSKPNRMIVYKPFPLPKRKFGQYQQKSLEKQKLNSSCSAPFHMKTRVSLIYLLNVSGKYFCLQFAPDPFKLNFFDNFGNSTGFYSFKLKLQHFSCKKVLKFFILGNCFSDLFTEVEIWY